MSDEVSCGVTLLEIQGSLYNVYLLLSKITCTSRILYEIIGLSTLPVKCTLTVTQLEKCPQLGPQFDS